MGKLKTKKGVLKRFRKTKSGKIKYTPSGKSHLASNKIRKRKRKLRKAVNIKNKRALRYLKRMLPGG